jgi:hypothetical protein
MESFCKSLIGKKAFDKRMLRDGIIDSIAFHNKDFSVCWFVFKHDKGAYLMSIKDFNIIEKKNDQLELFN